MFTQHFHLIFYNNLLWNTLLSKIIEITLSSATNKRKVSENHRFLRLPGKSGYKSTCGWVNRRRFGQMASYRFRHRKQSILSADPRSPPISGKDVGQWKHAIGHAFSDCRFSDTAGECACLHLVVSSDYYRSNKIIWNSSTFMIRDRILPSELCRWLWHSD